MNRREFVRSGVAGLCAGGLRASAPVSCILFWQEGGASHLDTFDVKPGGPFRAITTTAPGMRICEHLPLTAGKGHLLTVLRSMRSVETNHERASEFWRAALPASDARGGDVRTRCREARRMVQRGERVVRISHQGWDTHRDHMRTMREFVLPEFDRAFSGLLEDLESHRLLARTLVVAMGEFGRSPRLNPERGRDHHERAWSVVLAGGGLPGGRVLGATDTAGCEVADLPVRPRDLAATIAAVLDREMQGGGRVVRELLA